MKRTFFLTLTLFCILLVLLAGCKKKDVYADDSSAQSFTDTISEEANAPDSGSSSSSGDSTDDLVNSQGGAVSSATGTASPTPSIPVTGTEGSTADNEVEEFGDEIPSSSKASSTDTAAPSSSQSADSSSAPSRPENTETDTPEVTSSVFGNTASVSRDEGFGNWVY